MNAEKKKEEKAAPRCSFYMAYIHHIFAGAYKDALCFLLNHKIIAIRWFKTTAVAEQPTFFSSLRQVYPLCLQ